MSVQALGRGYRDPKAKYRSHQGDIEHDQYPLHAEELFYGHKALFDNALKRPSEQEQPDAKQDLGDDLIIEQFRQCLKIWL